jgi:hypothetical protein
LVNAGTIVSRLRIAVHNSTAMRGAFCDGKGERHHLCC